MYLTLFKTKLFTSIILVQNFQKTQTNDLTRPSTDELILRELNMGKTQRRSPVEGSTRFTQGFVDVDGANAAIQRTTLTHQITEK